MKLTYRKTYNQCICVLMCLLLMGSGAEGAVLCIGADGHIDLEPAFDGVCDDTVYFQSNEHCQSCLDIPVFAGCFTLANQAEPAPLATTAFIRLAASGAEFSENELILELSAITNPYLASIRSIILLV